MATFVSDLFAGTDGTALPSHTADAGGPWIRHTSYSANDAAISDANRLRPVGTNVEHVHYATATPLGTDVDIYADIYVQSVISGGCEIRGRQTVNGSDNCYCFRTSSGTSWELQKVVAGARTSLATFSQTIVAGNTYSIRLEIKDAVKRGYVNGVVRCASTNNEVTAAGRAAVGWRNHQATNSTGFHLDNFSALDAVAVPETLTAVGVG